MLSFIYSTHLKTSDYILIILNQMGIGIEFAARTNNAELETSYRTGEPVFCSGTNAFPSGPGTWRSPSRSTPTPRTSWYPWLVRGSSGCSRSPLSEFSQRRSSTYRRTGTWKPWENSERLRIPVIHMPFMSQLPNLCWMVKETYGSITRGG